MTKTPALRAYLVGIVSGLIGYWFVEDNSTTLGMDSVIFGWMLMGIFALLSAVVLRTISDQPAAGTTALLIWVGILTGVMGHIVYDSTYTEQTHNLFPLELAAISAVVLPLALIGAFGAALVRRNRREDA